MVVISFPRIRSLFCSLLPLSLALLRPGTTIPPVLSVVFGFLSRTSAFSLVPTIIRGEDDVVNFLAVLKTSIQHVHSQFVHLCLLETHDLLEHDDTRTGHAS
jgi:hypothetical protein